MKTKTFKLGEVCQGGIITVEITNKEISIIGKEWDYSKGSGRSSDQSGAKEFTRKSFPVRTDVFRDMYGPLSGGTNRDMYEFLTELTTSYHAEEVIKYVEKSIK
jgi:hypothetical protein